MKTKKNKKRSSPKTEHFFTKNGTLFSPNVGEDHKKKVFTKTGTLFFPKFQWRPALRCTPKSNYWGGYSQIIGWDIFPHPPSGFGTPGFNSVLLLAPASAKVRSLTFNIFTDSRNCANLDQCIYLVFAQSHYTGTNKIDKCNSYNKTKEVKKINEPLHKLHHMFVIIIQNAYVFNATVENVLKIQKVTVKNKNIKDKIVHI